jgi:ligand-binding SRPBCC domain-containing protein
LPIDARFEITTALAAPAEMVWAGAVDPEGINDELGPWVSMSMPKEIPPGMTIEDVELDVPVGRSWIKLGIPVRRRTATQEAGAVCFGLIPVDYDDLCLVERGPGMRFLERSKLGSARVWEHEREVVSTGESTCEVTDRLAIELRSPLRAIGGSRLAPRIIRALFTHRHKRLGERWGRL